MHQEECKYQASRRGGARRGPIAAAELAKKRARRMAEKASGNIQNPDADVRHRSYNHHIRTSEPAILPPSLLSPTESIPRPLNTSLGNCSTDISSPLGGIGEGEDVLSTLEDPKWSIRAYRCDQDLINAYYIFIHPYLPFLPPPATAQYGDKCVAIGMRSVLADHSTMPYWPTSPLGLALAGILALLPPPGEPHPPQHESTVVRRSYADLFARSALESLENSLESSSQADLAKCLPSTLHPSVPRKLEPVLALGLLSLFECCQHGNISKMRIRANQALTTAMDLSLYEENSQTACLDAQRRCWWSTSLRMMLGDSSSVANSMASPLSLPSMTLESQQYFRNFEDVVSCEIGRQLIKEGPGSNLPHSIKDNVESLDSFILDLAAEIDRFRCVTNYQGAEADASRNLWSISNALVHTARLTLHRVRAFTDRPVLIPGYCDYLAIGSKQSSEGAHDFYLSSGRIAEINAVFPFTEQESIKICFHSCLVVSRVFRRLPSPNPMYSDTTETEDTVPWASRRSLASPRSIPYMACCELQTFCIMAMILWKVRTAMCSGNLASYLYLLDRPSCSTQWQDAERLVEELQNGMEALARSIQADTVFEGLARMAKEVERTYKNTVVD
ncbi:Zn(II)2Cys6 transcription factor [Penicillium brasilianum]|uniref:Zn(II)2Cys6 transcription factor n=1 Tax=Penicillium brasilianum TaxID=104259 RepID=A0A1S9R8A1_PENBI|nr:Zn(II)2Cys6 transcription factor [Penicillium brasilianum]